MPNMTSTKGKNEMMNKFTLIKLTAALLLSSTTSLAAFAQTSAAKADPDYYRYQLGDMQITVLLDGVVQLPAEKILQGIEAKTLKSDLAHSHQDANVPTAINDVLIKTPNKLILIDAGAGTNFGSGAGHMLASLQHAGVKPEQIDEIYLTHMHPDHVGGLAQGTQRVFPNAVVRAAKAEADYWLNATNSATASDTSKPFFAAAASAINPYIAAGKFETFDRDGELTPGISAKGEAGHTKGHTVYEIQSQGKKALMVGDLIHFAAVQFNRPGVWVAFDTDARTAVKNRKIVFDDVAKEDELIIASHLPFPGTGYVNKAGKAYQWVPVNYATGH
jgi:glyoxylase-like metal-dependent hydrolase (beta-lactamase superfamily II)